MFGPLKGRGGDTGGKSDDQLINDLIAIHNAENWLGIDGEVAIRDTAKNPGVAVASPSPNNQSELQAAIKSMPEAKVDLYNICIIGCS